MLNRMFWLLPSLAALPLCAQVGPCTATLSDVRSQLGKHVVFCGTPSAVELKKGIQGDPVYIHFGGAQEEERCCVVVWGDDPLLRKKKLLKRCNGGTLRVKGRVVDHDGRPTILVHALKDIAVVKSTGIPQAHSAQ